MLTDHKSECPFCRGLHWHKYEYLETKMIEISRYVTIDSKNSNTWGEEIADILVLTGNAMDTFFKDMYDCPNFMNYHLKKYKKDLKLTDYQKIFEEYYQLSNNTVYVPFGLGKSQILAPFRDFKIKKPEWWDAYNATKHNFYSSMETSNLGNALQGLSGLLVLNMLHICSKWFLNWRHAISLEMTQIKNPLHTLNELTRSKIGVTRWAFPLTITTKLFNFSYLLDESVKVQDEPLVKF